LLKKQKKEIMRKQQQLCYDTNLYNISKKQLFLRHPHMFVWTAVGISVLSVIIWQKEWIDFDVISITVFVDLSNVNYHNV